MTLTALQHTYDEHRVWLSVQDGPTVTKRFGKRSYRVERVDLTYRRTDDDPWKIGSVDLRGPYLKKDGSNAAENAHSYWNARDLADLGWLAAAIERYTPGGAE